MATPKYKTSKSKAASRKATNMKLTLPTMSPCQTCGSVVISHQVCPKCGYYNGKKVIDLDAE